MFTRFATAALAVSLLGASAFALAPVGPDTSATTGPGQTAGVTVIEKNSVWPLKQRMSMDPCAVIICQEA